MTPALQQSTSSPYRFPARISGAVYLYLCIHTEGT